jgi:DNA-binding Xre family transcriptional regulator
MIVKWKVREVAERHGVKSASQLAEHADINKNTANALWNGTSLRVDRETLAKLCRALNCTTGDILEYDPSILTPGHAASSLAPA